MCIKMIAFSQVFQNENLTFSPMIFCSMFPHAFHHLFRSFGSSFIQFVRLLSSNEYANENICHNQEYGP